MTNSSEEPISDNVGNFSELNHEITNANGNVNLTKNHAYINGEDCINFTKSINVDGCNHTLDFNNESEVFMVNDNVNVSFNNLTFKNVNNNSIKFIENSTFNLTFIDCVFINDNNLSNPEIIIPIPDITKSYSSEVTSEIAELAKKIVGKSTDIAAAKKLAIWVNNNIEHETEEGFYQSPTVTLSRKMGNCCCHSELFVHMCEAIGLTKTHKIGFVHVGFTKFHKRHFFVVFDNLVVDTDGDFKNPWGHGKFSGRDVYSLTMYPLLPLERGY